MTHRTDFLCPFCGEPTVFEIERLSATFIAPMSHDARLVASCEHVDTIEDLYEAMEDALNGDRSELDAWDEAAMQANSDLGHGYDDPQVIHQATVIMAERVTTQ